MNNQLSQTKFLKSSRARESLAIISIIFLSSLFGLYFGIQSVSANKFIDIRIAPNIASLAVGEKQTFVADIRNGSAPYTIRWYSNDTYIGWGPSIVFSFSEYCEYVTLKCAVTDSFGNYGLNAIIVYDPTFLTVIESGSMVSTASYIVFKDGSTYYARNGITGAITYSGTSANTVIQSTLSGLTAGRTWKEKVVLKGSFTLTDTLIVYSYTHIELLGYVNFTNGLSGKHMFQNSDTVSGNTNIEISGGIWDGNKASMSASSFFSYFQKVTNLYVHDLEIKNFKNDGLHIRNGCTSAVVSNVKSHDNDENGIIVLESDYPKLSNIDSYSNGGNGVMLGHSTAAYMYGAQLSNVVSRLNTQNGLYIIKNINLIVLGIYRNNTWSGISIVDCKEINVNAQSSFNKQNGVSVQLVTGGTIRGNYNDNNQAVSSDGALSNGVLLNTYAADAVRNVGIIGVDACDYQAVHTQKFGIHVGGVTVSNINIIASTVLNNTSGQITDDSGLALIKNNLGFITESSGSSTITATNSYVVVTHGLAGTPTNIQLTPSSDLGGRGYWWSTAGATTFRIYISSVDLTSSFSFSWEAEYKP